MYMRRRAYDNTFSNFIFNVNLVVFIKKHKNSVFVSSSAYALIYRRREDPPCLDVPDIPESVYKQVEAMNAEFKLECDAFDAM